MANTKISALAPATTPLTGAELVPVVQGGVTKRSTVNQFGAAVGYLPAGTGAVATTVQTKLRESVSVLDFGAVGDGVTDDTAAIQAAVNAAIAVEFPSGTYLISANITLPRHSVLLAVKPRAVTIKSVANRLLLVQGGATNTPTTAADVEFRGILFEGVSITLADYVYWLRVIGCTFGAGTVTANLYNPLLTVDPTVAAKTRLENAEISGNRFVNVRRGMYLRHGFGDVNVRDNYINTASQNGILISTTDANDLTTCERANVVNNTILNIGTNATESYINAIQVYAQNATVIGNSIRNVKNVSYWEVDGIYVKAQEAVINDNEIYNGGYRSNIQTKQMGSGDDFGLNNGQIPTYSIVISGNSIYIYENSGFSGSHPGMFGTYDYTGKVFGGINIVTDNTLVSDNLIYGAGTGIYSLNSFSNWIVNNCVIDNNTIVANRGAMAIMWGSVGQNLAITNNKILNPTNAFSMTRFVGLNIYIGDYFIARGSPISWITGNADYDLRRIRNLTFADNIINANVSTSSIVRGMSLIVTDADMGGDVALYPGSFENAVIKGNTVTALNSGAGTGIGLHAILENDRFVNLNFDVSTNNVINATTSNFQVPTGYIQSLRMNNYRFWVDSTGDLRIKNGIPTSDTDGTVVGTQT